MDPSLFIEYSEEYTEIWNSSLLGVPLNCKIPKYITTISIENNESLKLSVNVPKANESKYITRIALILKHMKSPLPFINQIRQEYIK